MDFAADGNEVRFALAEAALRGAVSGILRSVITWLLDHLT
ncbi:hypothetical protein FBY34_7993 [Streptomyces sp. SLBN-115]|nr:hypothetical protein FBY34_7993 [Streptomyces sp. SLBN-115]